MKELHWLTQVSGKQQQLDHYIERISLPEQHRIYCQKGCGNCCSLVVNCSFPEAASIAHKLGSELQQQTTAMVSRIMAVAEDSGNLKDFLRNYRNSIGGCVFLADDDQACTIYSARPLTCRALLSTRPSAWCGVDFATLHPLEKEAFLSSLEHDIVNFPTHYLAAPQDLASELESDLIWSMQEQCGYGLSGNLIYLIWLELEHDLSHRLQTADFDLTEYLNQNQLWHSLLLHIRTTK